MNRRCWSCGLGWLLAVAAVVTPARGQEPLTEAIDFRQDVLRPPDVELWRWMSSPPEEAPRSRAARISLFRMPTGFLGDPIGTMSDCDDPATTHDDRPRSGDANDLDRSVQASFGMHNPFFDFRRSGDPGGIGFYRLYGQYQLLDTGPTAVSLGLQAVTPAGLEADGVSNGPTMLCPHLAWFQDLGEGAALQGFVGKNFRANADTIGQMRSGIHYGMAVQYPVSWLCDADNRGVYFFLEGLGRYRYDSSIGSGRNVGWDIVPGVHWRLRDDFWVSVGAARQGMFTCSWRY